MIELTMCVRLQRGYPACRRAQCTWLVPVMSTSCPTGIVLASSLVMDLAWERGDRLLPWSQRTFSGREATAGSAYAL